MHAHPDPRRILAAALAAIGLMLAALALPTATADLDLRLGGGGSSADRATAPAVVRPSASPPRWLSDPLAPPAFSAR